MNCGKQALALVCIRSCTIGFPTTRFVALMLALLDSPHEGLQGAAADCLSEVSSGSRSVSFIASAQLVDQGSSVIINGDT